MSDTQAWPTFAVVEKAMARPARIQNQLREVVAELGGDENAGVRALVLRAMWDMDDMVREMRLDLGLPNPPGSGSVVEPRHARPAEVAVETAQPQPSSSMRWAAVYTPVGPEPVTGGYSVSPTSEPGQDTASWKAGIPGFLRRNRGHGWTR